MGQTDKQKKDADDIQPASYQKFKVFILVETKSAERNAWRIPSSTDEKAQNIMIK
jgi:hypothetical protein